MYKLYKKEGTNVTNCHFAPVKKSFNYFSLATLIRLAARASFAFAIRSSRSSLAALSAASALSFASFALARSMFSLNSKVTAQSLTFPPFTERKPPLQDAVRVFPSEISLARPVESGARKSV